MKISDERLEAISNEFISGINPMSNKRELILLLKEAAESRVQLRMAAEALEPFAGRRPGLWDRIFRRHTCWAEYEAVNRALVRICSNG